MGKIYGGKAVTMKRLHMLYAGRPFLVALDIHGTILTHEHEKIEGGDVNVKEALRKIERNNIPVIIITDGWWSKDMEKCLGELMHGIDVELAVLDLTARYRLTGKIKPESVEVATGKADALTLLRKITGGKMMLVDDDETNIDVWRDMGAIAEVSEVSLEPWMIPVVHPPASKFRALNLAVRLTGYSAKTVEQAFKETCSIHKGCVMVEIEDTIIEGILRGVKEKDL